MLAEPHNLDFGVQQGSVLGARLYYIVIVRLPKVNADGKSLLCLPLFKVSLIIPQVCFMSFFRSVKVLKY